MNTQAQPAKSGFAIKKLVTLPLWKWDNDTPKELVFKSKIAIGKTIKSKPGEKEREPAHIAQVVNLEDGTMSEVIIGLILRETLEKEYPGHSYVEKGFRIVQRKVANRNYNNYEISELDLKSGGK